MASTTMVLPSSSSSISGFGKADDNIRILLMASVRNEFGDSCVHCHLGVTSLGQHYVLVTRKRFLGGYQTHMITSNMRNRPFISAPFKVSCAQGLRQSREFCDRLIAELAKPGMFSFDQQPSGCQIPTGKDYIQLDEVPMEVHDSPEQYLEKGDEVFCEINVAGIKFYHSGIYAGNGRMYHFVCDPQENDSLAEALAVFHGVSAQVLEDSFYEFVRTLVDPVYGLPKIFRASHPLICRSGDQIVKEAERLKTEMISYDIRRSNCQHFSSMCSNGVPLSYDMNSNFKYIACTVMKPTSTVVTAMTRTSKDRSSFNSSSS